jgi:hypothetical protein
MSKMRGLVEIFVSYRENAKVANIVENTALVRLKQLAVTHPLNLPKESCAPDGEGRRVPRPTRLEAAPREPIRELISGSLHPLVRWNIKIVRPN